MIKKETLYELLRSWYEVRDGFRVCDADDCTICLSVRDLVSRTEKTLNEYEKEESA